MDEWKHTGLWPARLRMHRFQGEMEVRDQKALPRDGPIFLSLRKRSKFI